MTAVEPVATGQHATFVSAYRTPTTTWTKAMLVAGACAGPVFVVVSWIQVATTDGFDISRHALSQLALGPTGWIQTTAFLVSGGLFLVGAAGLHRARPGRGLARWTARLLAVFAVTLVIAGVFPTDPAHGYPVGSQAPSKPSWHGLIHGIGPSVGILAAAVACLLFAVQLRRESHPVWAAASLVMGIQFFVPDVYPGLDNTGYTLALAITASSGFVWCSLVLARLSRTDA